MSCLIVRRNSAAFFSHVCRKRLGLDFNLRRFPIDHFPHPSLSFLASFRRRSPPGVCGRLAATMGTICSWVQTTTALQQGLHLSILFTKILRRKFYPPLAVFDLFLEDISSKWRSARGTILFKSITQHHTSNTRKQ